MRRAMIVGFLLCLSNFVLADETNGRLDIYFIDVEGGAATLFITPAGESLLIDSGYPDYGGRDRDRILNVIREVAKRKALDHAVVSHWHLDHYGNHAALADAIKIHQFWDRGIPEMLPEDAKFVDRIVQYRAASQNASKAVKPGDTIPLKTGPTPIAMKVLTASGDVVKNEGPENPFADRHVAQMDDPTDNAKSISTLVSFGDFRFLCCGDLTWNVEAKLVTPRNPVGRVDLFMATHHGLPVSNNPALVLAIEPQVVVFCNGPTKGAHANSLATVKQVKRLAAFYQLHRNVKLTDDEQAPATHIANQAETSQCTGTWIKASVAPGGKTYTVQVGPNGTKHEYAVRPR